MVPGVHNKHKRRACVERFESSPLSNSVTDRMPSRTFPPCLSIFSYIAVCLEGPIRSHTTYASCLQLRRWARAARVHACRHLHARMTPACAFEIPPCIHNVIHLYQPVHCSLLLCILVLVAGALSELGLCTPCSQPGTCPSS